MMANATIAASKAPVAILRANTPRDRITLNAVAGWRSASPMTRRRNVSVIGRRGVGATAARRGDGGGRKGMRRAGTTARECRITETNCPAKVRFPLPITSGGDVLLETGARTALPRATTASRPRYSEPDESE